MIETMVMAPHEKIDCVSRWRFIVPFVNASGQITPWVVVSWRMKLSKVVVGSTMRLTTLLSLQELDLISCRYRRVASLRMRLSQKWARQFTLTRDKAVTNVCQQ